MATPEALNALADRVERDEPSRRLNIAIWDAVCQGVDSKKWIEFADYTTSLDAAVTLVPEGMEWTIFHKNRDLDRPSAFVGLDLDWSSEQAVTPAAALTAAALRARAADMQARAVPSPEQKGSEK